ncbi:putative alpha beta hydrolase fold-3 protein [Neofusicoccum parvum UCRNP2]|uniref:Putative alpha beta hydrolase fold-3 protein n=1 Tax=Botryosphaeria parva (strain UCR-NP2) TaxID=1287680 RepID=R1H2X7_BOTPV|nr:putative alpha beta hydrolase fold-3 protein [Neofusicoccum parvum UCRNP2]
MMELDPDDHSRFDNFRILTTTYKTVASHAITTDILIPSHLLSTPSPHQPRPILLRFHGGGLTASSSLFPPFFAPWHLKLATRHSAIIVSPNYRLLPESSIHDVLADIASLWTWLHATLPTYLTTQTAGAVAPDTTRIMTAGDSAGGYLSVMLRLSQPAGVRAVTAAYPLLDVRAPHFTAAYAKPMFGGRVAPLPRRVVDEHVARVRAGAAPAVVSADARLERAALMFAVVQNGVYTELMPAAERGLFPLDRIEDGERLPRGGVFVWHGEEDSVVPVEGSRKFEELVRRVDPELKVRVAVRPGDHGFDEDASIDEEWMAEGLDEVVQAWLA